jgi:hypothetical protein
VIAERDATIAQLRGELDVRAQELRAAHDQAVAVAVGRGETERVLRAYERKLAMARAAFASIRTLRAHGSGGCTCRACTASERAGDALRALDAVADDTRAR